MSSPRIDVGQLRETYAAAREQDVQGDDEESSESLLTKPEDEGGNPNEAELGGNVVGAEPHEPLNVHQPIFEDDDDDDPNVEDSKQDEMRELFRRRRNMVNLLHLITVSKRKFLLAD